MDIKEHMMTRIFVLVGMLFISLGLAAEQPCARYMTKEDYADSRKNYQIAKQHIDPFLINCQQKNIAPDWKYLFKKLKAAYPSKNAYSTLLDAKLRWYGNKRDTAMLIVHHTEKINAFGLDTAGFGRANLNNVFYYMFFRHCKNSDTLNNAICWMKMIVDIEPENGAFIDTYANLLYKVGKKEEAIKWEARAIELEPGNPEMIEAWERMKKESPQPLDTGTINKLPFADGAKISDDGRFALYFVAQKNYTGRTLFFNSLTDNWKLILEHVKPDATISADSRYGIFINHNDSLGIVTLKQDIIHYIPDVASYHLVADWMIYSKKSQENTLRIRNLSTGTEHQITGVAAYLLNIHDHSILLQLKMPVNELVKLDVLGLANYKSRTIWQGNTLRSWCIDAVGKNLAFTTKYHDENELWVCNLKSRQRPELLATDHSAGITQGANIESVGEFSGQGNRILFSIRSPEKSAKNISPVKINIWSFTDSRLSSSVSSVIEKKHTAVIDIKSRQILLLQNDSCVLWQVAGDMALVKEKLNDTDIGERHWNTGYQNRYYLISLKSGKKEHVIDYAGTLSPGGNYLLYYDRQQQNYFCYSVARRQVTNITKSVAAALINIAGNRNSLLEYRVVGWYNNDREILLHDGHDIWQIDLSAAGQPVNLTNGYGRKNNIIFYPVHHDARPFIISSDEDILLTGFKKDSKQNGFFKKIARAGGDPYKLIMGDYLFFAPHQQLIDVGMCPQKAKNAEMFLVMRMTARESPNYFYTKDFQTLYPLSDIYPEKNYNWLTTELVSWEVDNNRKSSGILYKPANFDSHQKYPVLFYCYEKLSDNLHFFLRPAYCDGPMNIPWFVSRGYLVFTPDIDYEKGYPGRSALKTVLSAAEYLCRRPYIDPSKLGIQGHSFGGFEVNYIITHSNIFAAASSAAGISDLMSFYSGVYESGVPRQGITEIGQMRMGCSPWDSLELYMENSPLQKADKIITPLLLMHNDKDKAVPFEQGAGFFTALRRLGRKAWMVQYPGNGHILDEPAVAKDYTVRMTQFFDYYLKATPRPGWMH